MENPHAAVTDLVVKLHANIDSIHACINSLSDTSSHDAELERLEVEREQKIQELRKAHEDAIKALADQRQKEKEDLEEKRGKEAEELEEQRRREYEELIARRKKEDEARKSKLEAEETEREKIKQEEDLQREQEKEESERTLQEKVERELEALEDEMERKVEEGKKALRELDEKRKAINAQIDAALNTPTVIPTIHFRSRAKTWSRAPRPVSETFPGKEVGVERTNSMSDASRLGDGGLGGVEEKGVEVEEGPVVEEKEVQKSQEAPAEVTSTPMEQIGEADENVPNSAPNTQQEIKDISPEPKHISINHDEASPPTVSDSEPQAEATSTVPNPKTVEVIKDMTEKDPGSEEQAPEIGNETMGPVHQEDGPISEQPATTGSTDETTLQSTDAPMPADASIVHEDDDELVNSDGADKEEPNQLASTTANEDERSSPPLSEAEHQSPSEEDHQDSPIDSTIPAQEQEPQKTREANQLEFSNEENSVSILDDAAEHSTQLEETFEEPLSEGKGIELIGEGQEIVPTGNSHEGESTPRNVPSAEEHEDLISQPQHHIEDVQQSPRNSSTEENDDIQLEQPHPTAIEQQSSHENLTSYSHEQSPEHHVPDVIEPEKSLSPVQGQSASTDATPMETPISSGDQFFTPMVDQTRDGKSEFPLPDQSKSQEQAPTFPVAKVLDEEELAEHSDEVLPENKDVVSQEEPEHERLESASVEPVSHTDISNHVIKPQDEAGVDSTPTHAQEEVTNFHDEYHEENDDNSKKDHTHEAVDTSSTFSDTMDISQPMTAASSHADTWVSVEEQQFHPGSENGQHDAPSLTSPIDHESDAVDKHETPIPGPLGLGAATIHHSREIDREPSPSNSKLPSYPTQEDEHQRAINNIAIEPGFTPMERPEPELEEYTEATRPRTPIQAPHFSEHHAESPVTVLNADDLFADDSDDDDSFPLGQYQDGSPGKSSETEQEVHDEISDQNFEKTRDLNSAPEHASINQLETPKDSGFFANLVDAIRPDISLVRQVSDSVDELPEDSKPSRQSVSFDESAEPYYSPRDNLHIRTHTADTVPSFESYAHSDTPTSPSEAASSPFQETPHNEPRIQSSWHDEVPADEHQELKPQASPLQASFDPFSSTANPGYISPQSSNQNLQAEYGSFGYPDGVDVPADNVRHLSPTPSPGLPKSSASKPPQSEGRPDEAPISASLQKEPTSPFRPPSSLARKSSTSLATSNRTPTSSPSTSNSFFQKTRSLFETGAAQQSPTPSPPRPLSGFFSLSKSPVPPPRKTSRPSSLYQTEPVAEYNEEEDGEPIVPHSLDGDGRPPSPVFISSSPAHSNSRSGSISSIRKSMSNEDENFNSVNKRASNPFLGGLSRLVGAGLGGLEDSIHNPERSKLLGKDVGAEQRG